MSATGGIHEREEVAQTLVSKTETGSGPTAANGESLDALNRETGQPTSVLPAWREDCLTGGVAALKQRMEDPNVAVLERELKRAKRLEGDLMKERVPHLMRRHGLQAPHRASNSRGPQVHNGTIIPGGPNQMWGYRGHLGVDTQEWHDADLCGSGSLRDQRGGHPCRPARNPLRSPEADLPGGAEHYSPRAEGVAKGLVLRHDHGPQYMSRHFQGELAFLGSESSPGFVKANDSFARSRKVVAVGADLRHRRRISPGAAEVQGALQPPLATPAARLRLSGPGTRRPRGDHRGRVILQEIVSS